MSPLINLNEMFLTMVGSGWNNVKCFTKNFWFTVSFTLQSRTKHYTLQMEISSFIAGWKVEKLGLNWAKLGSNLNWALLQLNSIRSYWLNWLSPTTQNYQLPSSTHNLQSTQADANHPKTSPVSVYYPKLIYTSLNCHYRSYSIHLKLAHYYSGWLGVFYPK